VIGEWFVVGQLTGNPALAAALRAELTDEQAARALGLLSRAADWIEAAGPLFGEFAGGDVRRQVLAATRAALAGEMGRHLLDAVVAGQLTATGDWSLDQLRELDALIPDYVLLRTHAGIAYLVVGVYRVLTADDPAAYEAGLAGALNNLGIWLDRLGRYHEALDAAQETVTIRRALAATNPDTHQPNLAKALNNLGVRFDQLDRHDEALAVREEAVGIYRELAGRDPELYEAEYKRMRGALQREYDQRGMRDKAITQDLPGAPTAPPTGGMDGGSQPGPFGMNLLEITARRGR
jgi:tetratricopeptide (TPR) repeat protein